MNQSAINYTAICEGESVRIVRDSKLVLDTTREELRSIFTVAGNVFALQKDSPPAGQRSMSEDELRKYAEDYHREVCRALLEKRGAPAQLEANVPDEDTIGFYENFRAYLDFYIDMHPALLVRQLARQLRDAMSMPWPGHGNGTGGEAS